MAILQLLAVVVLACAVAMPAAAHILASPTTFGPSSVLTYHKNPSKDGFYVDSTFKGERQRLACRSSMAERRCA